MSGFILGYKDNQSQKFTQDGKLVPSTRILTSPCHFVGVRTQEKDGYQAIILGFGNTKNISKPDEGKLKKAGIKSPLRFLREFRLDAFPNIEIIEVDGTRALKLGEHEVKQGEEVNPQHFFQTGDYVDVTGVSKGKGFQGVVKRHNFRGGPKTHGQSDRLRAPGSIGAGTDPGRVFKGTRMAGRMGGKKSKIQKLQILEVNEDSLVVKGLIPGHKGGFVHVTTHK